MSWSETVQKFLSWTSLKIEKEMQNDPDFYFHEREIWWASLGVNIGFEQDGKHENFERPVLVLKKFNRFVLWIVPLTSTVKDDRHYFTIEYESKQYSVILSQLRLISSKRLLRKVRMVSKEEFTDIKNRIKGFL